MAGADLEAAEAERAAGRSGWRQEHPKRSAERRKKFAATWVAKKSNTSKRGLRTRPLLLSWLPAKWPWCVSGSLPMWT
jgi:hypothetical protein